MKNKIRKQLRYKILFTYRKQLPFWQLDKIRTIRIKFIFAISMLLSLYSCSLPKYSELPNGTDIYFFSVPNKVFSSKQDTLIVYKKRYYIDNRNKYYIFEGNNISVFERNGKLLMEMIPYSDESICIQYGNEFSYCDSVLNKYINIRIDSTISDIPVDTPYDKDRERNKELLSDLKKYQVKNMFTEPVDVFSLYGVDGYYFVHKSSDKFKTFIIYNKKVTDSLDNSQYLHNLELVPIGYYDVDFYECNDTLYTVSFLKEHLEIDSNTIKYFNIYSIYNGKKELISDSTNLINFLSLNKYSCPYVLGNRRGINKFRIIYKIDNTLILYNYEEKKYLFYDYINKKLFDPVIKIIDD